MDVAQPRLRSVSHSSLRSTYRAHGRPVNYTNPRQPAQRRPLRSLNENVALLRSPGPLESMLKTTTETGDIGLFSIKPTSQTKLPQSKPPLRDTGQLPLLSRSRPYEDDYYLEDHKRLRFYRDTASEIISLYGSDSQGTLLTSVSPTSLEDCPRSYSMTTTSSKRIPSHKSSGTLQSQSSSVGFQRPRSPFPYPTRLKRPGVRPASPALGQNGDIDYSRMVELDRFSQRTIHGSYKPTYTYGRRMPPLLPLFTDNNRPLASLAPGAYPSPYYYGQVPWRGRIPNSTAPWAAKPIDRSQTGSRDQSTRSPSLTSIIEMYNRPATRNTNCPPLRSAGSFYYDYSEEFENQPPGDIDFEVPLCPIPQRAGSIRRPMVLVDDGRLRSDKIVNVLDSERQNIESNKDESPRASDAGKLHAIAAEKRDFVLSTGDANIDLRQPPSHSETSSEHDEELTASIISDDCEEAPLLQPISASPGLGVNQLVGVNASDNITTVQPSPLENAVKLLKLPTVEESSIEISRNVPSSPTRLGKLRYSFDPALSDFASILSSFDRLGKTLCLETDQDMQSANDDLHDGSRYTQEDATRNFEGRLSQRSSLRVCDEFHHEVTSYQKRHRRNVAAMRISMTGVSSKELATANNVHSDTTILSPEPISPIHQLRVKESIPQLMKALPPLPDEVGPAYTAEFASIEPPTCSLGILPQESSKAFGEGIASMLETTPLSASVEAATETLESPPKFKVRVKATPSLYRAGNIERSAKHDKQDEADAQFQGVPLTRPKLKLKVSRSQLGQTRPAKYGTMLKTNRLKQCNSLAELAQFRQENDKANFRDLNEIGEEKPTDICMKDSVKAGEEGNARPDPSPQPSDQFNIPYPPSPDKIAAILGPIIATSQISLKETPSIKSDIGPNRQRGLRGKLSMLRLRFIGTPTNVSMKLSRSEPLSDSHEVAPSSTIDTKEAGCNHSMNGHATIKKTSAQVDKSGWRVKRWAHEAKIAVRSYVRKTLDRSPKSM